MSGHKRATIRIREADQSRFNRAGRQLEIVEQDYIDIKARVQQIQNEHLQSTYEDLHARQDHFSRSLTALDDQLQRVENGISLAIVEQADQMQWQFDSLGENFWLETNNLMERQSRSLQNVLDESITQQQAEFSHLQREITSVKQQQDHKRRLAIDALRSANELFESLQNTYDLPRLMPGLSETVTSDLGTTQQNIAAGFYEAGLVGAQQLYTRTSAARVEIENYLMQHSLACNAAISKGYEVLGKFDTHGRAHAIDLQGEKLDQMIDVDYWSWGAWRDCRRRCLRLVERLQRRADQYQIDEINAILQQILDCEEALPGIVCMARENVLASQVRFNLAECIVDSLQEQGFYLENSQYENTDQRQPYLTVLKNLEGSRVSVRLSPDADTPILHTIDLVSEDPGNRSEHEYRQRAKSLRNSLNAYGLQVNFSNVTEVDQVPEASVPGGRSAQAGFNFEPAQVNSRRSKKAALELKESASRRSRISSGQAIRRRSD